MIQATLFETVYTVLAFDTVNSSFAQIYWFISLSAKYISMILGAMFMCWYFGYFINPLKIQLQNNYADGVSCVRCWSLIPT